MAVNTSTDICNLALDHLGKPTIVDFSEGSVEAQACVRLYDVSRRTCLMQSPWTFARKQRALGRRAVNELADEWAYCYDLPTNMLHLHRMLGPNQRVERPEPSEPYYVESGSIYTDLDAAKLLYTWDNEATTSWSVMFDDVVALYLATRLANTMTRRRSDVERLQDMYRVALAEAIEVDAKQELNTYAYHQTGDDGAW